MNTRQFNQVSRQLNDALDAIVIDEMGRDAGFCHRERKISPFQLVICMLTSMACEKTESVADIRRRIVEWTGEMLSYRAVYSQLSKPEFPIFLAECLSQLLTVCTEPAQAFVKNSPFARFDRILVQDGSSFALSDGLSDAFPGRFTGVSPAAVELHVTMDLLADQPCSISLTADTASERDHLPPVEELNGSLMLIDRGYFDLDWFYQLDVAGGFFICRCLNTVNPVVEQAWSESGRKLKFAEGRKLKEITGKLLKRKRNELMVTWKLKGKRKLRVRLIAFWNADEQRYTWLVTNLPRDEFSLSQVSDAYRLRWQIELMFKEWKSYANLHRFNTGNPHLAEGLIWSSIAAAVLKRFCCLSAQRLLNLSLSTRRTAMCCGTTFTRLMICILHGRKRAVTTTLRELIEYLGRCARRSHPERERINGRAKLGLVPIGVA